MMYDGVMLSYPLWGLAADWWGVKVALLASLIAAAMSLEMFRYDYVLHSMTLLYAVKLLRSLSNAVWPLVDGNALHDPDSVMYNENLQQPLPSCLCYTSMFPISLSLLDLSLTSLMYVPPCVISVFDFCLPPFSHWPPCLFLCLSVSPRSVSAAVIAMVRAGEERGIKQSYGKQRLWCAVAWGASAFAIGALIDGSSYTSMFLVTYAILSLEIFLVWAVMPNVNPSSKTDGKVSQIDSTTFFRCTPFIIITCNITCPPLSTSPPSCPHSTITHTHTHHNTRKRWYLCMYQLTQVCMLLVMVCM